jgi:hypothetical protein
MGQYHKLLNMDLKQKIHPHRMGCGIKMWEILHNSESPVEALGILLSYTEGRGRPADLVVDGVTGSWAGHAAFYVGDYAEDGDLATWRWPLSEQDAYSGCEDEEDEEGNPAAKTDWIEMSRAVMDVLERQSGRAFINRDEPYGAMSVPVKAVADGAYEIDIKSDEHPYRRDIMLKAQSDVRARTDLSFIARDQFADGQRRLIVNLDKLEFLDPEKFDETATLAGMVQAPSDSDWSSLTALSAMLFLNEGRGGGDQEGEVVGRWRGDRLVILGDEPTRSYPGQDEVRATYRDISDHVIDNPIGG